MTTYQLVYDSRHLQADCQEPGSAPEPYDRQSSTGYLYLLLFCAQYIIVVSTLSFSFPFPFPSSIHSPLPSPLFSTPLLSSSLPFRPRYHLISSLLFPCSLLSPPIIPHSIPCLPHSALDLLSPITFPISLV